MDIRYFIGVDVSKATFDWAVFDGKTTVLQIQSANSPAAIRTTAKLSKALPYFTIAESVCCLEHTGIYCAHLLSSLYKLKLPIWLEGSLQIKKAGAFSGVRTTPLMQSALPSMPSVSEIKCVCGSHHGPFCKNLQH